MIKNKRKKNKRIKNEFIKNITDPPNFSLKISLSLKVRRKVQHIFILSSLVIYKVRLAGSGRIIISSNSG